MDFDGLISERLPPPNRLRTHTGDHERHLTEGAVMVVYAMHLFRTEAATTVRISPDGEHGKRFDFAGWLGRQGFNLVEPTGTTAYGGRYQDVSGRSILIALTPGVGDVMAELADGSRVVAECKGGVINSKHAGQTSRLRRGLCEVVGLLMSTPALGRQVAVVPHTEVTLRLAERMAPRCRRAGIDIALVSERGKIISVP